MKFMRNILGGNNDKPPRPRTPHIPDLGDFETKQILQRTIPKVPAGANAVIFDHHQTTTHYPRQDQLQVSVDADGMLTLRFDCAAEQVAIFDIVDSVSGYTLQLRLPATVESGEMVRYGGCDFEGNAGNACVDVQVYGDQGETVATRIHVMRDGQRLSVELAALVWVLNDNDGELASFSHVGARFHDILLPTGA